MCVCVCEAGGGGGLGWALSLTCSNYYKERNSERGSSRHCQILVLRVYYLNLNAVIIY